MAQPSLSFAREKEGNPTKVRMPVPMMAAAKPVHRERLVIILVVRLAIRIAAHAARFPEEFAPRQGSPHRHMSGPLLGIAASPGQLPGPA